MNDYKELIVHIATVMALEDECGQKELADMLEKAADAIEQLVKERDDEREATDEWQNRYLELARKCSQLEKERDEWKTLGELANKRAEDYREMRRQRGEAIKERDAAVKDMNTLCSTFADICSFCKNDSRNDGDVCVKCKGTDWLEFWEWRGVKDEVSE